MKIRLFWMLMALVLVTPMFGQSGSTKRVAILETVDKEGRVSYGVKLMVRSKLAYAITNTPGYEGYDRVDIASIMNEHDFQRTGLVSDAQIKRLGEMTGADYILVAEVAYLDYSHIVIAAKILNVETARVERTADVQTSSAADELEKNCRVLAGKLLNININTGAVKGELMIGKDRYVGEYRNGKPHGRGIMYYSTDDSYNRKYYDGDWVNGIREGNGTLVWTNGAKYVGAWKDDCCNGYGVNYYTNGEIYEGNWLNDKRHGKGKITFAKDNSYNRKYYNGDWLEDILQGIGTMEWNSGAKYIGGWKNGEKYGEGVYYWAFGDRYNGNWDDERNGKGIMYYANGDRYDGNFVDGKRYGVGTYYFKDGRKRVGYLKENKWEGEATFYFTDGRWVKEYWVNGERHGEEKWYRSNGHHYMTKIYKNGVLKKTKYHK